MDTLKKLFDYTDYRKFMEDYFSEMKRVKEFFSFRYFAAKAGFKSPNFCYYVIKGRRNLSHKSLKKIISAMGLKGKEAAYFEMLVLYNQTDESSAQDELLKKMEEIKNSSSVKVLSKDKSEYASHWYMPVIRELAVHSNWNNYKELASMVYPKIEVHEARNAVKKLVELGLIKKSGDRYVHIDEVVSLNDIPLNDKLNIRREILRRGYESVDRLPVDKRYVSYSTLSLTQEEYVEVTKTLTEMRRGIVTDADSSDPNGVYQLVLQLFPVGEIRRGEDE